MKKIKKFLYSRVNADQAAKLNPLILWDDCWFSLPSKPFKPNRIERTDFLTKRKTSYSKLKQKILIIIIRRFTHLIIFFLYSTNVCFSSCERFFILHDHIVAFFIFLLQKDFDIFHESFLVVFLCYLDNI